MQTSRGHQAWNWPIHEMTLTMSDDGLDRVSAARRERNPECPEKPGRGVVEEKRKVLKEDGGNSEEKGVWILPPG